MPHKSGGKRPTPATGAKRPVTVSRPSAKPGANPPKPVAVHDEGDLLTAPRKPAPPAAPRVPISVTKRQERLARHRELQRRRSLISSVVVVIILGGLFAYLFANHFFITLPAAKPKACAIAPTTGTPALATVAPVLSQSPTTLPDGLKYIDIRVGCGATAATTDTVHVNYTGWLLNGNEFDSSMQSGRSPLFVSLDPTYQGNSSDPNAAIPVIPGWREGLVGMKVGGVRRLIIPPALAYGATGAGTIPANATIVFDVSLLSIP